MNNIKFPIIAIAKQPAITVYQNEDTLTKCFKRALDNGYFKNLIIIDSGGTGFKVIDATKVGTVGGLWGYDVFLDQTIRVKLQFDSQPSELSLEEVKKKTLNAINKNRSFWYSGDNILNIESKINTSNSVTELIDRMNDILNKNFK